MVAYRVSKKRVAFRPRKTIRKKTTKGKVATNTKKINALVKTMNNVAEQKVQSLVNFYLEKPKPQVNLPSVGPVYYHNSCLGNPATTWLGPNGQSNFSALDGFQWAQGTGPSERVGRYLFLKHTTAQLRIDMLPAVLNSSPTQFRVIVYKAKRNSALGSAGGNPNEDLFIDNAGRIFGFNNSSVEESRSFEFMNMLINKRNYSCVMDKKFILQPSVSAVQGGSNVVTPLSTVYPCEKTLSLRLNHNSKTAFSNFNQPLDLNYQYCTTVIAAPLGAATIAANDWRISMRGTVSCIDS